MTHCIYFTSCCC